MGCRAIAGVRAGRGVNGRNILTGQDRGDTAAVVFRMSSVDGGDMEMREKNLLL